MGVVLVGLPSSGPRTTADSQLRGQILGSASQCSSPGARRHQELGSVMKTL